MLFDFFAFNMLMFDIHVTRKYWYSCLLMTMISMMMMMMMMMMTFCIFCQVVRFIWFICVYRWDLTGIWIILDWILFHWFHWLIMFKMFKYLNFFIWLIYLIYLIYFDMLVNLVIISSFSCHTNIQDLESNKVGHFMRAPHAVCGALLSYCVIWVCGSNKTIKGQVKGSG